MFLGYSFCHFQVADHLEINNLSIHFLVLFIIVLVEKCWILAIAGLYFCRNSPVRTLILANNYLKKSWKNKSLTIELVTQSENFYFLTSC